MIGELLGPYRVTGKIAEGGMGAVYACVHTGLGYRAAVKVLLPHLSTDQVMVARFFTEAQAASMIKHPALVHVFEAGYSPRGAAYIVMEYLEGELLAAKLRREGRLDFTQTVSVGQQVASALASVHQKGIIHRDLKPENLFLVSDARAPGAFTVKVLDFGIAKLTGLGNNGGGTKTRTGSVLGTPAYMSPEQCRGAGNVDWRSDIYALGCILFELACGQPPFHGAGFGEILAKHIYEVPPRPSVFDPRIPPLLENAIVRALAKQPQDRWQTMDELLIQLDSMSQVQYSASGQFATAYMPALTAEQLAAMRAPAPPPKVPATTTLGGAASEMHAPTEEMPRPSRRKSKAPIFAGLGLAAVGCVAAIALTMGSRGSSSTPGVATAAAGAVAPAEAAPPQPAPPVVAKVAKPVDKPAAPAAPADKPIERLADGLDLPSVKPAAAPVAALLGPAQPNGAASQPTASATPTPSPPAASQPVVATSQPAVVAPVPAPVAAKTPPTPAVDTKPAAPAPSAEAKPTRAADTKPAAADAKPAAADAKPAIAKPVAPARPKKPIKDGVLNPFSL